jgi:type IV pilus assembly protein PilA
MIQSIKNRIKNQKGLTLIELLAVIVILGIIAAIAVPSIGKLIGNSEDDAKVAEGIQIINAAKLYSAAEAPATITLTHTADTTDGLAEYLDHVKDPTFSVTITKTNSGKYNYILSGHDSVSVVNGTAENASTQVDEKALLNRK